MRTAKYTGIEEYVGDKQNNKTTIKDKAEILKSDGS
jgi:hypothetical protein